MEKRYFREIIPNHASTLRYEGHLFLLLFYHLWKKLESEGTESDALRVTIGRFPQTSQVCI